MADMIKREKNDGLHAIIEGIDGSGKSTVLNACRAWAEDRGVTFFNVIEFSEREGRLPNAEEVGGATGLITAEPTFCWVGKAIREEIIAKHDEAGQRYTGWETAQAFALDRLVQFRRLVIPFLQNHPERIIFQDRGLGSSLAYQPLQDTSLTTKQLVELPGNAQTLAFSPSLLILIRAEATATMARLAQRTDKQDKDIFEEPSFQQKLAQRYLSDDVLGYFKQVGTKIAEVDGNQGIDQVASAVKSLLSQNLPDFGRINA
ncbi:MAG: dTMP kinase [Patescibacteria group bacterium]